MKNVLSQCIKNASAMCEQCINLIYYWNN